MPLQVDLYYTMRSPYCYLSTPELVSLSQQWDLFFHLKPVYPLAVSDPTFFERVNPLWPRYVAKDTARIAQRLGIPFFWPKPDPIVQDMQTREIAEEQPYIRHLTRMAQLAADQQRGVDYVAHVSGLIFGSGIDGWDQGDHLNQALRAAGFDPELLQHQAREQAEILDQRIEQNRAEQLDAGHWGAPLFVFGDELFFGQDRLVDLVWYLQQQGLRAR